MSFVPVYILILFLTIAIDYVAGILIEEAVGRKRLLYLIISLLSNISILAIFKYYNFFIENVNAVFGQHFSLLAIILPIGLSFHTFQAMSYTIEVYRGNQAAERHFGIYSLYVMFYPQLVAGPIERPQNILHQFHEEKIFSRQNATIGLRLMLLGFFKKIVVGDQLGIYVDSVYGNFQNQHPLVIILATIFYSIQIYCDFSGYSLIAIGSARVMGYNLMKNFDRPYASASVSEFWSRWHISLSTWFKDYLYIPLGGNRVSTLKWMRNILIVFILSGLWHGANKTFILWGALHALALIYETLSKGIRKQLANYLPQTLWKIATIALTFCFVTFSWIFFRSPNLTSAFEIIRKIFQIKIGVTHHLDFLSIIYDARLQILLMTILLFIEKLDSKYRLWENVFTSKFLRYSSYYVLTVIAIYSWLSHDSSKSFIYFQF